MHDLASILDQPLHEVRTALNAITGFASILGDEIPGRLNDHQQAYVGKILGSADRIQRLINTLVDLAALESGTFRLERRHTTYAALVAETVQAFKPLAEHKLVRLVVDVDVPHDPWVDGPRVALALSNLLSNALAHNPTGGFVEVKACIKGDELITSVTDGGPGLRDDDAERALAGQAGLGLRIGRKLIEAHGGRLGVDTSLGNGATFWYALPLSSALSIAA
ncbi:MAG: histidine kinase [Cyanobacteria bacterium RYN_339]|nr:histidine kinase [Cyanobacteria bacterium RYN_339]